MVRRLTLVVLATLFVLAVGGALLWVASAPVSRSAALLPFEPGDPVAGEPVFHIGGCASCHAVPRSEGEERFLLGGGHALETPFGDFLPPNISPHPEHGIAHWSAEQFAAAMLDGVSPDGAHYYPSFPYASYARMTGQDVADLWAFLQTLPAVDKPNAPNALGFPYSVRRGLGLWKRLAVSREPVVALGPDASEAVLRGQYLVEGPGHCGECHTPRTLFGAMDTGRWLAGAPSLEGDGNVPSLAPGSDLDGWSEGDIAGYLNSGLTPDFDTAGGTMVDVIRNTSQLPDSDRRAIAAYLKALPR